MFNHMYEWLLVANIPFACILVWVGLKVSGVWNIHKQIEESHKN